MPLQDESYVLEELRHFPEQELAPVRKQAILENIREEASRMEKRQYQKKYVRWVANGLLACALIFTVIWLRPYVMPNETAASETVAKDTDQTYIAIAQKALAGIDINKQYHFVKVEQDEGYFRISTENREAIVTVHADTKKVRTVAAHFSLQELGNSFQKYLVTAQEAWKSANQQIDIQDVHFFKDDDGATLSFGGDTRQYVKIDLVKNQVTDYLINYKPSDVDSRYVSIAQKALLQLSNSEKITFTKAERLKNNQEELWTLSNGQKGYLVKMEAKSGRIHEVRYETDRYHIKKLDEALAVATPLVRNIFGLELAGYKAYGGRDWGGYQLKREGKPTVVVSIGNLDVGNIISMNVKW